MELINERAQQYAERYTSGEDELLRELGELTRATHPKNHMLSGHLQGALLSMISCMIRPRRILEIGTFTGYSALCLAKGLGEGGELHTVELREADAATAQTFIDRSFYKKQIILHIGNALDIVDELQETWDLVFIDADKDNYINYFHRVFPKVNVNGFILADNVLFHGQVLEAEVKGKNAKAIQAFNDHIQSRSDIERLFLPVRDGIYVIRKLH